MTSTDGKAYNTRIFSEYGCIKLAFFANTKASSDFRDFASQALVERKTEANVIPTTTRHLIENLQREVLRKNPRLHEVKVLTEAGIMRERIAKMVGIGETTVRGDLKKLKALGLEPVATSQQLDLFGGVQ